jgi:hypothetical protein
VVEGNGGEKDVSDSGVFSPTREGRETKNRTARHLI